MRYFELQIQIPSGEWEGLFSRWNLNGLPEWSITEPRLMTVTQVEQLSERLTAIQRAGQLENYVNDWRMIQVSYKTIAGEDTMSKRYKYTTARQVGGDDGYCWAVFVNGRERVNGLTRREVRYYRDKWEQEEAEKAVRRLHQIESKYSTEKGATEAERQEAQQIAESM